MKDFLLKLKQSLFHGTIRNLIIGIVIWFVAFFLFGLGLAYSNESDLAVILAFIGGGFVFGLPIYGIYKIVNFFIKKGQKKEQMKAEKLQELSDAIHETVNDGIYVPIECDIALPKDEVGIAVYGVAVYKEKVITKRFGYSGFRYRIKIAKGFSYNIGTINPTVQKENVKYLDDTGILYITNERIIIKMTKKVESIKFNKLLYVEMIDGGTIIYKDSGKPIALNFISDYTTFPMYIDAFMNKVNQKK